MEEKNTAGLYVHIPFVFKNADIARFVPLQYAAPMTRAWLAICTVLYAEMDEKRPQWEGVSFRFAIYRRGYPLRFTHAAYSPIDPSHPRCVFNGR